MNEPDRISIGDILQDLIHYKKKKIKLANSWLAPSAVGAL
jgi:hypothetical protein